MAAGAGYGAAIQAGTELIATGVQAGMSASEAKKARKHQEKLMQTKYQWQMRDMKAAGLNPILASGATPAIGSSPMASYNITSPDFEDISTRWATKDARTKEAKSSADVKSQQGSLLEEETETQRWQQKYLRSQQALADATTGKTLAEAERVGTLTQLDRLDLPRMELEALMHGNEWMERSKWIKEATGSIGGAVGSFIGAGLGAAAGRLKGKPKGNPSKEYFNRGRNPR